MSEAEKREEVKHSGRNYPLGALNPKDNPKLLKLKKEEEKVMKKTFVVIVCIAVAWAITLAWAFITLSQETQISTLKEELKEVKEDVHSLRSQTVALDKKVFRNFTCLMANGKLNKLSYQISERCIVEEVGNKNFKDWIEISKNIEQWGWQLVSIGVVGLDEEEGEKLLNLFKENEIGGEKVDAIFNPGSTVGVRFSFYPVETMKDFDLKKKREEKK